MDKFKILLKFLKKKSIIFLISLILLYKLIFNGFTANYLIDYVFKNFSTGTFQGTVTEFSLFYGLEFKDIKIHSGTNFDNRLIFQADRLAVLYSIPQLFLTKIRIHEISLIQPKIYLYEKNNEWNISKLFVSKSSPTPKVQAESKPLSDSIDTKISIDAKVKILVQDLLFELESGSGEKHIKGGLEGFHLYFQADTKRFSQIPLSQKIFEIFEVLSIRVNPEKPIRIHFEDHSRKLDTPLQLSFITEKQDTNGKLAFHSKLDMGIQKIPLYIKNQLIAPFGFQLFYDIRYEPDADTLKLTDLSITVNQDKWIQAAGVVTNVTKKDRSIDFELTRSEINLEPVSKLLKTLPGMPEIEFKGFVSLSPILLKGNLSHSELSINIRAKDLYIKKGNAEHRISFLNLIASGILSPLTEEKPTKENPIPILKKLVLTKLDLNYNNISVQLNGLIETGKEIGLNLSVKNVDLNQYVKTIQGITTLNVQLKAKDFSALYLDIQVILDKFRFKINKNMSGRMNLNLNSTIGLLFNKPFGLDKIQLNKTNLLVKNQSYQNSLSFNIQSGLVDISPSLDLTLDGISLISNLSNLSQSLPLSLRETVQSVRKSIGDEPKLSGFLKYSKNKSAQTIQTNLNLKLPKLTIGEILLKANLNITNEEYHTIKIQEIKLETMNSKLKADVSGILKKVKGQAPLGPYIPDLKINLSLTSMALEPLYKNISFKGKMDIKVHLNNQIADGAIRSEDSYLEFQSAECPSEGCKRYLIEKIKIDFPFQHDLNMKTTQTLSEGNKTKYIKTYGQTLPSNFTIHKIVGTHPSHPDLLFEFVKNNQSLPGFSARLDYKENFLTLSDLQILILDGIIYGKDVLFNIGNGKTKDMEYTMTLQVRDIDLKQLMRDETRKKIDDGKICADVNIRGKNLEDPVANLNLFFSVFQIGNDFGKSAINIVSPQNLLTDYIVGSYSVNKLEVELSKGLVYASVLFKTSLISSLFVKIEDNKISQERVPLSNFLKRAENEIYTYK